MHKTAQEIKLIKKSQEINESVFKEVLKKIKPGVTEKWLAKEIRKIGRSKGSEKVAFPPIVAFGSSSAEMHHIPTDKKLRKGQIIMIDMGMVYKGYCSDMTRMIFTAPPTAKQQKIYNLVLKTQNAAIKKLKAIIKNHFKTKNKTQITSQPIAQIARDIIRKEGYEKNFIHGLGGHGIGKKIHEKPFLSPKYTEPFPKTYVVTVEPGLYFKKSFGIRLEDMVLVKGDEIENLTGISKKIRIIKI